MRRTTPIIVLVVIALVTAATWGALRQDAGVGQDAEQGNRALAAAFETAWNTHDMDVAFRKLLTDDVDWVNVDGYRGAGIKAVVEGHVRVHADKFKESVMTIKDVQVASLTPEIAISHVTWGMRGDRDNDGTAREPREGIFTWVTVKAGDSWKIRASHNSNKNVIR